MTNYSYNTNTSDIVQTNDVISYDKKFQIVYSGTLSSMTINQIISSKNTFYSWSELKIDSLKYIVSKDSVEILITPSSVMSKNENITGNIPAGMLFVLSDNILQYDFRIMKDNVFVRIKGIFVDKSELFDKIALALEDPILYVRRNEPDYMLEQIDKHEEEIALLRQQLEFTRNTFIMSENSGKLIEQDVINAVLEYKKAHTELTTAKDVYNEMKKDEAAYAVIKDNKYKFSQKIVEIILRAYLGLYD